MKRISLCAEDLTDLNAMLDWWRHHRNDPLMGLQTKPIFRGTRKNTGVVINSTILEKAIAKAKNQKALTGGSISSLVEILLWRYIGEPVDVLDIPTDQPDPID